MSAPVDVLAVARKYAAERQKELDGLQQDINAGGLSGYEKELADVTALRDEANAAVTAVAELIEAARAVEIEVRPYPPQRPYSGDSYLPESLREPLAAALARCGGAS